MISSDFDILDISNSGTIHGGLNSVTTVDVENSGTGTMERGPAASCFP